MESDSFLAHYGVKGMKWGVRKKRVKSEDYKESKRLKKKRKSELSNKELRTLNERMRLESEYDRLKSDRKAINRGHSIAKKVVSYAGTATAVYALGKKALSTKAGKRAVNLGKEFIRRNYSKGKTYSRSVNRAYKSLPISHDDFFLEDSLSHFGIKGMKWGVRRFREKDGSLTPEGKKRYGSGDNEKDKKSSKSRDRLIDSYVKNGYTKKEAEAAADKRLKTQKILIAAAGVTAAAAAAYLIGRNIEQRTDQLVKAGDTLQRIEMEDTKGKLHDVFYATNKEKDNSRYRTVLGFTRQQQTGEAYVMKLVANKDVKVASRKNAQKTFENLYNTDEKFRRGIQARLFVNDSSVKGRRARSLYDSYNQSIVNDYLSSERKNTSNRFYNALKKQGYGAIQDVNDMDFSGYSAKNPLIFFDNADRAISSTSSKKLSSISESDASRETIKMAIEGMVPSGLKYGSIGLGVAVASRELENRSGNLGALNDKQAKRAKQMRKAGKTYSEIAEKLGVPEGAVSYYLNS